MAPHVGKALTLSLCLTLGFVAEASAAAEGESAEALIAILDVDPERLVSLTKAQKDYAATVGEEVVCLCGTCPRHTITACNCGWAHKHKKAIEIALLDGKTREQIHDAYMKAYGAKAFPTPPGELGDLAVVIPYAAIGLFLVGFVFFGIRMMARQRQMEASGAVQQAAASAQKTSEPADPDAAAALERELEDLD